MYVVNGNADALPRASIELLEKGGGVRERERERELCTLLQVSTLRLCIKKTYNHQSSELIEDSYFTIETVNLIL